VDYSLIFLAYLIDTLSLRMCATCVTSDHVCVIAKFSTNMLTGD